MTSNTATKRGSTTTDIGSSGSKSSSNNPKKNPKSNKKQSSNTSTTVKQSSSTQQQQQNEKAKTNDVIPKLVVATDPPLECTKADFDALLVDAAGLVDYDEASSELLDCARYGTFLCTCVYVCIVICTNHKALFCLFNEY